jgi:hypothetical protein
MSKPRFYVVRPGFWLHGVTKEPIASGTVVELTDEQAEGHAHQIEDAPKGSKVGDAVEYAVVPAEVAPEAAEVAEVAEVAEPEFGSQDPDEDL